MAEFEIRRKDILSFFDDNEAVTTRFMDLVLKYNTAAAAAKTAIMTMPQQNKGHVIGPFKIATPPKKVTWSAENVPDALLRQKGVIKSLDAKVLDALVKNGLVPADVVAAARSESTGTAAISGPTLIVINP